MGVTRATLATTTAALIVADYKLSLRGLIPEVGRCRSTLSNLH